MNHKRKSLVFFTQSYPYDLAPDHTFVSEEIKYLPSVFEKVVIVPEFAEGHRFETPPGVQVDESLASQQLRFTQKVVYGLILPFSCRSFYKELYLKPHLVCQPTALKRMASWFATAWWVRDWVLRFVKGRNLELKTLIFYSYRLGASTFGIGLAKLVLPELVLVSRAHGMDLYEERLSPPYHPFRGQTLHLVDRLYLISDHGKRYIVHKFPEIQSKCETFRLGVRDRGITNPYPDREVCRIVSCSGIAPVKRLELLARGLSYLGKTYKNRSYEWHHIGDGSLRTEIENLASQLFPSNVRRIFYGAIPNEEVFNLYGNIPFDVFVNVSQYEGLPVAVMEAISCGIPAIATAVGGNPEIVSERNGILLSENPDPSDIAKAIVCLTDHEDVAREKRKESKIVWLDRFDADINYERFSRSIAGECLHGNH